MKERKGKLIAMPKSEAPPAIPAMPMKLEGFALEHWNYHAEGLVQRGFLDSFTAMYFCLVCWSWRNYMEISKQILNDGVMVLGPKGHKIAHPLLAAQAREFRLYRMFAKDMGIISKRQQKEKRNG